MKNRLEQPSEGTSRPSQMSFFNRQTNAQAVIQPKLTVGSAHDAHEHEANRTADMVMRKPSNSAEKGTYTEGSSFMPTITPVIQRACAACEHDKEQTAQRKETGAATGGFTAPPSVSRAISRSGNALDSNAKTFMESRFNRSFDNVQVHTDSDAASSARDISARAYTSGNHIVFGEGQYQPNSEGGRHLLAHELTHVVQQSDTIQRAEMCDANGYCWNEPDQIQTSGPNASYSPSQTSGPNASYSPSQTSEPNASYSPSQTSGLNASYSPSQTSGPNASYSPSQTSEPNASYSPSQTSGPNASYSPSQTSESATTTSPTTDSQNPVPNPRVAIANSKYGQCMAHAEDAKNWCSRRGNFMCALLGARTGTTTKGAGVYGACFAIYDEVCVNTHNKAKQYCAERRECYINGTPASKCDQNDPYVIGSDWPE
jgi:hypothetical protein